MTLKDRLFICMAFLDCKPITFSICKFHIYINTYIHTYIHTYISTYVRTIHAHRHLGQSRCNMASIHELKYTDLRRPMRPLVSQQPVPACSMHGVNGPNETNHSSRCSIADAIVQLVEPLIEAEVDRRSNMRIQDLSNKLESCQSQYAMLLKNYEALQLEMERSRQLFEKKKAEWRHIKDMLSQKKRPRTIFSSAEEHTVCDNDQKKIEPESVSETNFTLCEPELELQMMEETQSIDAVLGATLDPLAVLAAALGDKDNNGDDSGDACDPGVLPTHVQTIMAQHSADSSKRDSFKKLQGALRNKSARKQAHAKDCSCCSKVINSHKRNLDWSCLVSFLILPE